MAVCQQHQQPGVAAEPSVLVPADGMTLKPGVFRSVLPMLFFLVLSCTLQMAGMAGRIARVRGELQSGLESRCPDKDWSFITKQIGMFSYTGMTPQQVRGNDEHHGFLLFCVCLAHFDRSLHVPTACALSARLS